MKPLTAILAAAAAAAIITLLTTPSEPVTADPMPAADAAAMHACASRPWPYLHCVGTKYGDPNIRLVGAHFAPGH